MRHAIVIAFATVVALAPVAALADELKPSVFDLQFSGAASGAPTIEQGNGLAIFKLNSAGAISGDLTGTYTQALTQIGTPDEIMGRPVNLNEQIATYFTITTADGTIEGYYAGVFYFPQAGYPNGESSQVGKVLSVTGAYAGLYMADVYYTGHVKFEHKDGIAIGLSDTGSIVLAQR